eukprot:scaffold79886_cov66-Attheya_sp.AAC.1
MAKIHTVHCAFSSTKSRRGNRPQRSWSMVNKVSVHKACHGWEDLVKRAYQRKKTYGYKLHDSCLARRKQLLVCDLDSSVSALIQDTVSGTVRPTTMDAIATAIIPQNLMATNSREQIIAISATISSSLGRK